MDEFPEVFTALEYREDNSFFMVGLEAPKNVNGAKTLHPKIPVSIADEFIGLMEAKYPINTTPSYSTIKKEFKEFLTRKG